MIALTPSIMTAPIRLGRMPPLTGLPDFTPWQRRRIDFMTLADDARACYAYITAYASHCGIL